jgi:predicted SAM-dependent methyltransferase
VRLVVGAKHTQFPGWQSTDRGSLDIREPGDWRRLTPPDSIERILCEHVLEHMTAADALRALENFRDNLEPGGFARIAVPDALNPDPYYQNHSRPGALAHLVDVALMFGPGEPAHFEHYDYKSLSALIERAGLRPRLVEWFDESGVLHRRPWDYADGEVRRSLGHPFERRLYAFTGIHYLSLIIDAVKV